MKKLKVNRLKNSVQIYQVNIVISSKFLLKLITGQYLFFINFLVADSEEKLCRLVSEFGRVCEEESL